MLGEIGSSGLKRWGGHVDEEFLRELRGLRAIKVYREMRDNDDIIGAVMFAFEYLAKQIEWRIDPGGDDTEADERAEFVRTCLFEDMSQSWQDARRRQWGEESAIYKNRVLGEFAASEETGVIPLAWVEAANRRWLAWKEQQEQPDPQAHKKPKPQLTAIGVDVAWEGSDRTTIAPRLGDVIETIEIYRKQDPLKTAERVAQIQNARGGIAVVDVIGLGAGTVLRLRELGKPVIAFVAGAAAILGKKKIGDTATGATKPTRITDESGEVEFADMRSAAHWHLRELLNPANGHAIALPPDDALAQGPDEEPPSLAGELCAAQWDLVGGGKIKVESKDDIFKRLKRSTDLADPVVQAFAKDFLQLPLQGMPLEIGGGPSKWRV